MSSPKELLFGRMAISRGLLTKEQLDECVRFQQERAPNCPLGLVMIDKGFLTSEQLQELVTAQKEAFQGVDPQRLRKLEDAVFGQIVIKEGMASTEEVHQALRDQALEDEQGHARRLGEILVEKGLLLAEQVEEVLAIQRRRIVLCPSCGAQFNVEKLESGKKFMCGKCRTTLTVPAGAPPALPIPPRTPSLSMPGDLESAEYDSGKATEDPPAGAGSAPSAHDLESMRTMAVPAIGRASRAPAPEPDSLEEADDAASGTAHDLESMRTMAVPAIGRASAQGGADDLENLRTMEGAGVGRMSGGDEEAESAGLEGMQTMAVPGIGRRSDEDDAESTGLESMRTMALPAVGAARPKGIDPDSPVAFTCECGRKITAPAKMAGKTGKCPGCGKKITIPKALAPQMEIGLAGEEPAGVAGGEGDLRNTPGTKTREKPVRRTKAGVMPAGPDAESDGMTFTVEWAAGTLGGAKDAGLRGAGSLIVKHKSLVFSGRAGKRTTLLTYLGAPICLGGGGAALALQWLPQIPAVAAGLGGAIAAAVLDRLLHRGGGTDETLEVECVAVKEYKSEPKPKVSFAVAVPGRGEICFTLVPKPADRKRLLQVLSEMF